MRADSWEWYHDVCCTRTRGAVQRHTSRQATFGRRSRYLFDNLWMKFLLAHMHVVHRVRVLTHALPINNSDLTTIFQFQGCLVWRKNYHCHMWDGGGKKCKIKNYERKFKENGGNMKRLGWYNFEWLRGKYGIILPRGRDVGTSYNKDRCQTLKIIMSKKSCTILKIYIYSELWYIFRDQFVVSLNKKNNAELQNLKVLW